MLLLLFKSDHEFFINGVHPSGYNITYKKTNNESADGYRNYIYPNNTEEKLQKKKILFSEFLSDVEDFKKKNPIRTEKSLSNNKDFLINLVDKYGFLEGTKKFYAKLRKISPLTLHNYNNYLNGETLPGLPGILINDDEFSSYYIKREKLKIWVWLLNHSFLKPNQESPRAAWEEDYMIEQNLIDNSFPTKNLQSNKITLEPSCLGTAYLFFRYYKNISEIKRCENCEKIFPDVSRSNKQKFCSDKCRVSAHRKKQVSNFKKEMKTIQGSFRERIDNYQYVDISFNDSRLRQIRRICKAHGEFPTKISRLKDDPGCPMCDKN